MIAAQTPTEIRDVAIDESHVATCGEDGVRVWSLAKPAQAPIMLPADCSLVAFLEPGQLVIANKRLELLRWKVGRAGGRSHDVGPHPDQRDRGEQGEAADRDG